MASIKRLPSEPQTIIPPDIRDKAAPTGYFPLERLLRRILTFCRVSIVLKNSFLG